MQPFNPRFVAPRRNTDSEPEPDPQRHGFVPPRPTGFHEYAQHGFGQMQHGFVNLLQQHDYWGLNPQYGFGGSQPVPESVPETQPESVPESQPEPQPETQRGRRSHAKKKGPEPRAKRSVQMWTQEEEYCLARAWLDVSEDPLVANYQNQKLFWARIREAFFRLVQREEGYRANDSISGKWTDLNTKCQKFQSVYQRMKNGWKSGQNDEDIISAALVEYQAQCGNFSHLNVWRLLRGSPKWANIPSFPTGASSGSRRPTKRSKTSSSVDPETPTSDARNLNLNEDNTLFEEEDEENDEDEAARRPPGRRCTGKGKKPESSSVAVLADKFDEMNKRLERIGNVGAERSNENKEMIEIMRTRQEERDFRYYTSSTDHLSGKSLEWALKRKAEIEKKYGL